MEPILQIIKYLFKKKNIDNNDDSIASFFSNGQSFPDFIALIFDIEVIPGVKKNPTSLFQRKINNTSALQFLFQKNQKIKMINPCCENEKDQKDLLRLILTMQCYTSTASVILDKSNTIVEKFGIQILKKDDLITLKFLSLLLNILTEGIFPLSENLPDIIDNCIKYNINCPIFINEDSLKAQNSFIFLIQIQIIFEVFSEKIEQILNQEKNSTPVPKFEISDQNKSMNDQSNTVSQVDQQSQINFDDQKNQSSSKTRKRSSAFQDKINSFNNTESKTENSQKEKSFQNSTNINLQKDNPNRNINFKSDDNKNQSNDNKIRRSSSSFQDKIDAINNKEAKSDTSNNKAKQKTEQNDQNQKNSDKKIKISADKLALFGNSTPDTGNLDKEKSTNSPKIDFNSILENKKNDQNQSGSNQINLPSFKLRDSLNILDSQEKNKSESSSANEKSVNSDSQSDTKNHEKKDKLRRISTLLQDELKLFDNLEDTQNDRENHQFDECNLIREYSSNFEQKISIYNNENNLNIPPPMDDQSPNIEKFAQTKRLPQSYKNNLELNRNIENKQGQEKEVPNFDIIQKLINDSKGKPQKEEDFFVRQVLNQRSKEISCLWNPPNPKIFYLNGVLCDKSKVEEKEIPTEKETEKAPTTTNPTSKRNSLKVYNNVTQIFKYDEENYNWYFCDLNFEQLFNNSNNKEMVTPLILFVDSNEDAVIQINQCLKKNKFNFESEESISVFAFQKKPTNVMLNSINNEEAELEEPYFMFVHVPKSKRNSPQIATILFQIYTFLFMISDLNIVIFEKKHKTEQILFIKGIIEIGKMYSESKESLFKKESDVLFLAFTEKDKTIKLKKKIEPHIIKFQLNCLNNYIDFVNFFETYAMNHCTRFCELKKLVYMADSYFSQINGLYLELRSKDNIYTELHDVLLNMFGLVEGNTFDSKLANLENESKAFYPNSDDRFACYIDMILTNLKLDNCQDIHINIVNRLKKESQNHLSYLKKKINEKKLLTEIQMNIIERSHINFLQNQFFNIIRDVSNNNFIDNYYEKNSDILDEQIKEDRIEIKKCFNRFLTNWSKKETVIEKKYEELAMKGTNYVMREVQKTREIEVIVAEDGDIDTLIDPDF